MRIAQIVTLAESVVGAPDKAHAWLRKPNRALNGIVPIDLLKSENGAHMVEQALRQIEHGIYV